MNVLLLHSLQFYSFRSTFTVVEIQFHAHFHRRNLQIQTSFHKKGHTSSRNQLILSLENIIFKKQAHNSITTTQSKVNKNNVESLRLYKSATKIPEPDDESLF